MSKNVDLMLKVLFERDQAVADVFNFVFGKGSRLVEPSMLRPASERELALMRDANGKWEGRERTCDVARRIQWDDSDPGKSLLLFIENQLHPHLLMPWRVMELQDMSYERQVRAAKELLHQDDRRMDGVEFLRGVAREFRFARVVTIVIYWGAEPWDVPLQFADMLEPVPFPELQRFEPRLEYPLLIPSEISREILQGSEHNLNSVLNLMGALKDRKQLEELLRRNPSFQAMPRRLALGLLELAGCQ